jgi:Tfp pilus assembly protein PilX
MGQSKHNSRGFTLIAALLITVLLSGVAAGLLFMVSNEVRMGGNGLEDNLAYYGAESGMEKLSSDLAALYQGTLAPTNNQIQNLVNFPPTSTMVGSMNYVETITYPKDANGNPVTGVSTISAGVNQGMYAQTVPMTLQVIASRPSAASVNITRNVEVALIPVFQFGVFCGYDCSYFAGPNFSFGGRVHTNGNLFLASGANLVFNDKIAAFGQILLDRLENDHLTSAGYGGTVYGSTTNSGCPLNTFPPPTGPNCVALTQSSPNDASWSGGVPLAGAANGAFPSISSGTFNGYLSNSLTGATNMQLPFVQNPCGPTNPPPNCTDPIAIIRKPLVGESSASTLGQSRLYNKAQIRVLLASSLADLHPERGAAALDLDDVKLDNTSWAVTGVGPVAMAQANTTAKANANWVAPFGSPGGTTTWPLISGYLRVEYLDNASPGVWHGVTREWLQLGFARGLNVPNVPGTSNGVNPNAILIFQELADYDGDGTVGNIAGESTTSSSANSWYPINLYDTREGEMRDNPQTPSNGNNPNASCAVNGIMNTVEIDTGNLKRWLAGTIGANGAAVNYTNQNGYLLYFSDRRGMLPDPNATPTPNILTGESGLEDVVNSAQPLTSSTPDGAKEPSVYYAYSPEDVNQNGVLDNWGGKNIGYGVNVNSNTNPPNPYLRIASCFTTGRANAVTGARHGLKVVDGGLGNLPTMPLASGCTLSAANPTGCGGFTVASENPVYVQGDYNTNAGDPLWAGTGNSPHAAAAIIADAVTVLSNNWQDSWSMYLPTAFSYSTSFTAPPNPWKSYTRIPTQDTYYRMAVGAGKNIPFPQPGWAGSGQDFGTDGGLHNFLRYLENWGGVTLHYNGSLVNMYYSEYNTGTFKCCSTVYSAPRRNFFFDTLFLIPSNLPPGTPMFQDVVSLGYHANFTPQ